MKNKKIIIILFLLLTIFGCKKNCTDCTKDYTGYIIDSLSQKPVGGVYVKDIYSSKSTFSDSVGYFIIPYAENPNTESDLFFFKENFANDTLNTILYSRGNPGQHPKIYRTFVGEKIEHFYYKDKIK